MLSGGRLGLNASSVFDFFCRPTRFGSDSCARLSPAHHMAWRHSPWVTARALGLGATAAVVVISAVRLLRRRPPPRPAAAALPSDIARVATTAEVAAAVRAEGVCVVERVLDAAAVAALRERVAALEPRKRQNRRAKRWEHVHSPEAAAFAELAQHPSIAAAAKALLGPKHYLEKCGLVVSHPGAELLARDAARCRTPSPSCLLQARRRSGGRMGTARLLAWCTVEESLDGPTGGTWTRRTSLRAESTCRRTRCLSLCRCATSAPPTGPPSSTSRRTSRRRMHSQNHYSASHRTSTRHDPRSHTHTPFRTQRAAHQRRLALALTHPTAPGPGADWIPCAYTAQGGSAALPTWPPRRRLAHPPNPHPAHRPTWSARRAVRPPAAPPARAVPWHHPRARVARKLLAALSRRLVRAVRPEGDAPRRGERERGGAGTRLPHPLPRLVQRHAQPVTNRGGPLAFCSARAQTKRLSFAVLARDRYSYSEDGARPVRPQRREGPHTL